MFCFWIFLHFNLFASYTTLKRGCFDAYNCFQFCPLILFTQAEKVLQL